MLTLTSPKITVGVHCAKLRTKGMYMNAVVDPDELKFYDPYDNTVYCACRPRPGSGPTASRFERMCAAANAGVASSDIC